MRLNHDCIRSILFQIEEKATFSTPFVYLPDECPELSQYTEDEVCYHINQLHYSGLCTKPLFYSEGVDVADLTPEGHKYVAEIRSDTNWNKIKEVSKQASVWTLDGIKQIAAQVAAAAINQILNP